MERGRLMPASRVPADLEDALRRRYGDRPQQLAEVLANAEAWEEWKATAGSAEVSGPNRCNPTRGER